MRRFIFVISIILSVFFIVNQLQIRNVKKRLVNHRKTVKKQEVARNEPTPKYSKITLPPQLQALPLADESGIVLGVKNISVPGINAPYNPSIIKYKDHYAMVFRYDVLDKKCKQPFYTYVGCTELDKNFYNISKQPKKIDTGSKFSEDARIIQLKDDYYLIFNDLSPAPNNYYCRTMRMAQVDLSTGQTKNASNYDLHFKPIEKNWAPFVYNDSIHFEYSLNPHKILEVPDPKKSDLAHLTFPNNPYFQHFSWPSTWGEMRGGSPAQLIDGQYVGFFHSFFRDKDNFAWYVMGAYTFEPTPPFRITAVSSHPILFQGIYETSRRNTGNPRHHVIYPGSFVVEETADRKLIHLACGENDSTIKIVTLDKEKLLNSLKPVAPKGKS